MSPEEKAPAADPPESPPPSSPGDEGAPGPDGAAPDPAQIEQERQKALEGISDEALRTVFASLSREKQRVIWGPDYDSDVRRRVDSQASVEKLESDRTRIERDAARRMAPIRDRHKDDEQREQDLKEVAELITDTGNQLRAAEWQHAMRSQPIWAHMNEDDRRKLASVQGQPADIVYRVHLETLLGVAAREAGSVKAGADDKGVQELHRIIQGAKGSAEQVSSQQIALGLTQLTYSELANRYGRGTATPEEETEYLRQREERKTRR